MIYLFAMVLGLSAGFLINLYLNSEKVSFKKLYKFLYDKPGYIIVEAATIILFEYIMYCIHEPLDIVRYCILTCILVTAALEDIKEKVISNSLIAFSILSSIALTIASLDIKTMMNSVILFAITTAVLYLLYLLSRGGMGLGDAKLLAGISVLLGERGIISVFAIAVILSGILSLILIIAKKIKRKDTIPFTPFILAAVIFLLRSF